MNDERKRALEDTAIACLKQFCEDQAAAAWEALLSAVDTQANWMVVPQEMVDEYRRLKWPPTPEKQKIMPNPMRPYDLRVILERALDQVAGYGLIGAGSMVVPPYDADVSFTIESEGQIQQFSLVITERGAQSKPKAA